MIKTTYDPEADILHVSFEAPEAVYEASEEVYPGVNFAFDTAGRPVSRPAQSGNQVCYVYR